MNITKTARGFARADFVDRNGEACSIQESSLATERAIWLGVDEVKPTVLVQGVGWQPVSVPPDTMLSGRMHLTQEQVRELLPLLQHFAETGELPERGMTQSERDEWYLDQVAHFVPEPPAGDVLDGREEDE